MEPPLVALPPPRVAICFTGTWRTFVDPDVHLSIAENVSAALAAEGAEVGHFFLMDSVRTPLRDVLPGLEALPPRVLQVDSPPPRAPPCLRTMWAHTANFVQWGQVTQCFRLVLEDERVSGKRWDWVVRTRADIRFPHALRPAQAYDPGFVHVPRVGEFFQANVVLWGIRQTMPILNEQFFLVPRDLVEKVLLVLGDFCPESSDVAHVAWTPFLEYTILYRLLLQGIPLRFLEFGDKDTIGPGFWVKRRGKSELDEHHVPGAKAAPQMHESRFRQLLSAQPGAFGNGSLGAERLRLHRVEPGARVWDGDAEGDGGLHRVVLDTRYVFRDHFALKAVRVCLRSRPEGAPTLFQVRVYRPLEPKREFWRLIAASEDLGPSFGLGGARCFRRTLSTPLVGAPGDALAYIARGDFVPGPAALLRVGLALAAVGEFGAFEPAEEGSVGVSLAAEFRHFDRNALNSQCYPPPEHEVPKEKLEEVRTMKALPENNYLFSYDYCCDMEAQGPEGHRACWDLFVFPGAFNYKTCCILPDNRVMAPAVLGGDTRLDVPALRCAVARSVVVLGDEMSNVLRYLTELTYQDIERHMEFVFAAPKWPEDAFRPKYYPDAADPPFLPALFRFPREICANLLLEFVLKQTSCASRGGWHPRFDAACAPFVLLHARVIAAGLDDKDPRAFFAEARWL